MRLARHLVAAVLLMLAVSFPATAQELSDRELYEVACANCHGADGRGPDRTNVAFDVPVPDFTDCSFASREPDADWVAVAAAGGPVRGFDETMPAFGEAFTDEQLQAIMDYIRTLCTDDHWPRGELNLPRPLITEKAYPEDEAVSTITVAAEGDGAVVNELLYERRFGALNQLEVKLPFGVRERPGSAGDWNTGLGDVTVGLKRVLYHSLEAGAILSVGGEVKLPTGSETDGFGAGTPVLESFLAFGQILPADAFVHVQLVAEFPTERAGRADEFIWRAVLGRSWTQGRFGRTWSPMVEVLGKVEGGEVEWDVVPQMQVTLNTRQHVMLNAGVRVPLTDAGARSTQLLVYLLWDWYDGGFFDGW